MRREICAAAVLALAVAGAARAQEVENYRRFTTQPGDTNRNNRIIYAPIVTAYPGSRPVHQPYEQPAASWYQKALGTSGKPDKTVDHADYRLERFDSLKGGDIEVVITRTGGRDESAPELRVTEPKSLLTSRASAHITAIPGGNRYTFTVRPPLGGFAPPSQVTANDQYLIEFMASGYVSPPSSMARKPTFDGVNPEIRALQGPPRLPNEERVAGKRMEYRSAKSAPTVVTDPKVAGKRQEYRDKQK
jgi:hypothetical protein